MTKLNAQDIFLILSWIPDEEPEQVPKGLDPTFYHTLDYEKEVGLARRNTALREKLMAMVNEITVQDSTIYLDFIPIQKGCYLEDNTIVQLLDRNNVVSLRVRAEQVNWNSQDIIGYRIVER